MSLAANEHVPWVVQEALVEAAAKMFWYRQPLAGLLRRAGAPAARVEELIREGTAKAIVMRTVLGDLESLGAGGAEVERRIVREMVAYEPRDDVEDLRAARAARDELRRLAEEFGIVEPPRAARDAAAAVRETKRRRDAHERRARDVAARRAKLDGLRREFVQLFESGDRQRRGYALEIILGELAMLEGLPYQGPYRNRTVTQTDGMITFDAFQYLIEARWRSAQPDAAALTAFGGKVARTLQSTRGLFVSVTGFRDDVVQEIQSGMKNLLLMNGQELTYVLEGRCTLTHALRVKVDECAKRGTIFYDISQPR